MEGGEATDCFILTKKGGESTHGARHDGGKVAVGQSSSISEAMWSARKRTRGEELERRPAWRRCVDATRVNNSASGAAAVVSYGGDGKQLLAARAAAWHAWERPAWGELRRWVSSGATRGAALEQEKTSGGAARRPVAALLRGRGGGAKEEEQ
jgi:hypothetical protein